MLRPLFNVLRPALFQGAQRDRDYFEGYYLKVVDPERGLAFAVIPGVSYDADGDGHGFVQVIDGVRGAASYARFDVEAVTSPRPPSAETRRDAFALKIGNNRFSESGMRVRTSGLRAELRFRENHPWPWRPYSPGAMGPFSFAPGMQCKHAVVSLHHRVEGTVQLGDAEAVALGPNAVGYIEKDWGSSFPLRWTWLQTSHLAGETAPSCLMVSAGVVPWVTGAFDGHIAALLWRGRLEVFATYNGSRMTQEIQDGRVRLRFECGGILRARRWLRIDIDAPHAGTQLAAPAPGSGMTGHVNESLTATAQVSFGDSHTTLLETEARWVGFELGGAWARDV